MDKPPAPIRNPQLKPEEQPVPQALEAVVKSLYACARIINGEPVDVLHKIDNDGEEIFVRQIDPNDPGAQEKFNQASGLIKRLKDYYTGDSLHLVARDGREVEEKYRFLVNIRDISVQNSRLVLEYQPNGELLEIDISKLGIDFDIYTTTQYSTKN